MTSKFNGSEPQGSVPIAAMIARWFGEAYCAKHGGSMMDEKFVAEINTSLQRFREDMSRKYRNNKTTHINEMQIHQDIAEWLSGLGIKAFSA